MASERTPSRRRRWRDTEWFLRRENASHGAAAAFLRPRWADAGPGNDSHSTPARRKERREEQPANVLPAGSLIHPLADCRSSESGTRSFLAAALLPA
jgi:hypothetical protein